MKKNLLVLIFSVCFSFFNTAQATYILTRQAQLENLRYEPKFPIIDQHIFITTSPGQDSATMIYDLSIFQDIDTIIGNLVIEKSALTNLSGLHGLKVLGEFHIYDNDELTSLSTLDGPWLATGYYIQNNANLKSCGPLSHEMEVDVLKIKNNPNLKDVTLDLDSVIPTWKNYFVLHIKENQNLDSIWVLSPNLESTVACWDNPNLTSIHIGTNHDTLGGVSVQNNGSLQAITGFQSIDYYGLIWVSNNPLLNTLCFAQNAFSNQNVLDYQLKNNGQGANSVSEILATDCSDFNTSIKEQWLGD
ncbi:MAG: hypothetical protein ACPGRC_11355, partial [Salibacteraceae bacterium]